MSSIPSHLVAVFTGQGRIIIREACVRVASLWPGRYQVVIDEEVYHSLPLEVYIGHDVEYCTYFLLVAVGSDLCESHVIT